MKVAIITTTINYPELLIDYARDSISIKKKIDLSFYVAGDLKTPKKTIQLCKFIKKKFGIPCFYLDPKTQDVYLNKFLDLKKYLSWNSVQRRNVAFLKAAEDQNKIIITIDDDNFLKSKNFVKKHIENFSNVKHTIIKSNSGWFNVCDLLLEKNNNKFFHRGYPVSKRYKTNNIKFIKKNNIKVGVNAGLWLGDPDIDAVTRLANKIVSTKYKFKKNFALDIKTNSPFNSQNTAISADLVPCYFLSSDVGRMDDIYASYITRKIGGHLKYYVSYGEPIVRQNRNDHNIWKDLDLERLYHENLEDFLIILDKIKINKQYKSALTATNYLIKALEREIKKLKNIERKAMLLKFTKSYSIWIKTVKNLKMF